jgi:ABC-type anion transport system duplicated permease subunit
MHPKRVVIARVSAIIVISVIAVVIVAAVVGAFGSLLLGHLFPIVQALSSLPAAAHELGLRSSE